MSPYIITALILLGGSAAIGEGGDLFAHPICILRKKRFFLLRGLPVLLLCSFFLFITGSVFFSILIGAILLLVIVTGSNLKLRLLNEPLVFTDFALISSFVKHPRFYMQAVPISLRCVCVGGVLFLILLLIHVFTMAVAPRLVALASGAMAAGGGWYIIERHSRPDGPEPSLWNDIRCDGLLPTLILYAARCWRLSPLPAKEAITVGKNAPEAIIIVQCESYADPSDLHTDWSSLPVLARSRKEAIQWGMLKPSGFGAYTMRSEYGVLCGGTDTDLSYRQFDPFLAASQMPSHAIPHRLSKLYSNALFLHPYDLRFYGRDVLTPLWGFTDIVGGKEFSDDTKNGPYVSDEALSDYLLSYLHTHERFLAYCVTIENHGPWKAGRLGQRTGAEAWLKHVENGDAMLDALLKGIKTSGRDVMLVFFGDHRPALENVPPIEGLERSTPYVVLRPNAPDTIKADLSPKDLTPAGLHEALLEIASR